MAELQGAQQAALATLSMGLGQQGAAPGGSSTDTFNQPQGFQPIKFSSLQSNDSAPLAVTITTSTNPGAIDVPAFKPLPVEIKPALAADVSGAHAIIELPHTTGSATFDSTPAGVFTFTHFNFSTASASLESITWSGSGVAPLPGGLGAVLASALTTSVSIDSIISTSGTIAAKFSAPDQTFDFLAAGETLTITYNVTVTDNLGASLTQPVTITITGSNDAPVLAADASGPHTTIQAVQTSGTLTFTDVDLTDQHTASTSVTSTSWPSGVTPPSGIDAVLAGALSATVADTGSGSGSVAFTFSAGDALDFLAAGQKLTIKYNVTVTDDSGVSSTQPVTITVIGTNDVPVITSAAQTGAVTEHTNVDSSGNLNAGGAITFSDVDLTDKHTVTFTPGGSNYLGTFTPTLAQDATGGSTGIVGWTFSVSDKAVEFLAEGQTLTQTYTVLVADNNGGFASQTVTITITGTNDAPVLSAITQPASVPELPDASAQDIAAITGTLPVSDLDVGDTFTASIAGTPTLVWSGGSLTAAQISALTAELVSGKLTFAPGVLSNGGAQTIGYTYDPTAANLDFLRQGDTLTIGYSVQVSDGHVTSAPQPLNFVITGTDNAPVLSAITQPASVPELPDASAQDIAAITGTLPVSDLDVGDTFTASIVGTPTLVGSLGSLTAAQISALTAELVSGKLTFAPGVLSNGGAQTIGYTYDPTAANLDFLRQGDTLTIGYSVQVSDGHVTAAPQPLNFVITGTDDAPVLSVVAAGTPYTGTAVTLLSAATVTDVDNSTLASATVSITSGLLAGDVLAFTNTDPAKYGNIVETSYNAGVLTLTSAGATAKLAQWQAALDAVQYSSTSNDPTNSGTDTSRTISWVVNDGTLPSATQTTTLNIANVKIYDQNTTLNGDNVVAAFIEIKPGVTLSGFGTINANVLQIDQGATIVAQSSHTLDITVTASITGKGKLEITNNTTLKLTGPVASTLTVQFDIGNGPSPVLILEDPSDFHAQITGFQSTDQIRLPTISFDPTKIHYDPSTGILTIDGTTIAITFVGSPNLKFAIDPTGGTLITDPPASTTTTDASTTIAAATITPDASTTTTDATVTPVAKTSTLTATKTTSSQTKATSATVTDTASSRTNATLAAVDEAVLVALNTAVVVATALDNAAAATDAGATSSVTIGGNGTAVDITDAVAGSDAFTVNSDAALGPSPISQRMAETLPDNGTVEVINGAPAGAVAETGAFKIDAAAALQLDGSDAVDGLVITDGTNADAITLPQDHTTKAAWHAADDGRGGKTAHTAPVSETSEDTSAQSTSADNHFSVSSPSTATPSGDHTASAFKPSVDHDATVDPGINLASIPKDQ